MNFFCRDFVNQTRRKEEAINWVIIIFKMSPKLDPAHRKCEAQSETDVTCKNLANTPSTLLGFTIFLFEARAELRRATVCGVWVQNRWDSAVSERLANPCAH